MNFETGELRPQWCNANSCHYCGWVKSVRTLRALKASEPTTFLTLTDVPEDWQQTREAVRLLRKSLARSGHRFEWAYVKQGAPHRPHLHALAHGHVPDAPTLAEHAGRAGLGSVVAVRPAEAGHAGYMLREALGTRLDAHLADNHGRLVNASRHYFRIKGTVTTYGEALRAFRADCGAER